MFPAASRSAAQLLFLTLPQGSTADRLRGGLEPPTSAFCSSFLPSPLHPNSEALLTGKALSWSLERENRCWAAADANHLARDDPF